MDVAIFYKMSILSRLLEKRGITEDELVGDEKAQFDQWKKTLSGEEVSVEKIKDFCQNMVGVIEGKWRSWDLTNEQKAELLPYHTVYKAIIDVINGSKVEREQLEEYLQKLIER